MSDNDITTDPTDAEPVDTEAAAPVQPAGPDDAAETEDATPEETEPADPELLRTKLRRRTGENIELRHRAQDAEAQLAALQAEAVEWQRDYIELAGTLMDKVLPEARQDLLKAMSVEDIQTLYRASKITEEQRRKAHKKHYFRVSNGIGQADSYGSNASTDPEDVRVRKLEADAKGIIDRAIGGRAYLLAPKRENDLARTMRQINAPHAPKTSGTSSLARALMRH